MSNTNAYPVSALPVSDIVLQVNETALRTVDKNSRRYMEILESARKHGITTPILVRTEKSPETGKLQHILVDGDHRLKVAQELGFETIQAQVRNDISAVDGLALQIVNNYNRVETKKCQLANGILRILAEKPEMTMIDVSAMTGIDPKELEKIMSLTKLDVDVQKMVDNSVLPLAVGFAIAKLPEAAQKNAAEELLSSGQNTEDQIKEVNSKIKEIRDAARQGKAAPEEKVFSPVPHARKFSELKEVVETPELVEKIVSTVASKNKAEIAKATLLWTLHLDPESIKEQQEQFNKQRELEAEKKRVKELEKARLARERAKAAELKEENRIKELESVRG